MWLINTPIIRIEKYKQGFAVEIKKRRWYGVTYWKHIISYSGMHEKCFYYDTFEHALEQAVKYFKWDLIINSRQTM